MRLRAGAFQKETRWRTTRTQKRGLRTVWLDEGSRSGRPRGIASANAKPAPGSLTPAPPPNSITLPPLPPNATPSCLGPHRLIRPALLGRARDENAPLRAPPLPLRVTWVGRWGSALSTQVAATGFFSLLSRQHSNVPLLSTTERHLGALIGDAPENIPVFGARMSAFLLGADLGEVLPRPGQSWAEPAHENPLLDCQESAKALPALASLPLHSCGS